MAPASVAGKSAKGLTSILAALLFLQSGLGPISSAAAQSLSVSDIKRWDDLGDGTIHYEFKDGVQVFAGPNGMLVRGRGGGLMGEGSQDYIRVLNEIPRPYNAITGMTRQADGTWRREFADGSADILDGQGDFIRREPARPGADPGGRVGLAAINIGANVLGSLVGRRLGGSHPLGQLAGGVAGGFTAHIAANVAKAAVSKGVAVNLGTIFGGSAAAAATLGISAAITGLMLLPKAFGRGRRRADEFVQRYQNPFAAELGRLHDAFYQAVRDGSISKGQAMVVKATVEELWAQFKRDAEAFAAQGSRHRTVVNQAYDTLDGRQMGGRFMTRLLDGMHQAIEQLRWPAPEILIRRPYEAATVSRVTPIEAEVVCDSPVQKLEFLVDETSIGILERPGIDRWGREWDTTKVTNGEHAIVVRATNAEGTVNEVKLAVTVANETSTAGGTGGATGSGTPAGSGTGTGTVTSTGPATGTVSSPTSGSAPPALRPLAFPEIPVVQPPASLEGKEWLTGWAEYAGGKRPQRPEPCGVRFGNEPFCRERVAGVTYTYEIDPFYRMAEAIFWQLAAQGEIRPPAPLRGEGQAGLSGYSDFIHTAGPTTHVFNVARATLRRHNNLPVEGAIGALTRFTREWSSGAAFDPRASQADIIRSQAFQSALNRQFAHNFPQYAFLLSQAPAKWPAEALHAREHLIADLLSMLASRRLNESDYLAMVEVDKAAGRLPEGFRSYLSSRSRGPHGECGPTSDCRSKRSFPPGPEMLCMDIGNDGRFELWPAEQQPPCGASTRGEVTVFASSCGWQPAVCAGLPGVNWKFLGEVRKDPAIPADVVRELEAAVGRHGMRIPPGSGLYDVDATLAAPRPADKASALDSFRSLFASIPDEVRARLVSACDQRGICEPAAACLAANAYDACAKACEASRDCGNLELFPPKPKLALSPSRVRQGEAREVFVSNAVPGSEVAIWCQDPSGAERCSGMAAGSTNANGERSDRGQVTAEHAPGRWCAYAVVAGQRSNAACYTVEAAEASETLTFALRPSRVAYGGTRDVIVTHASANAEVEVYCQDPQGVERCSGWKAGSTDAAGSFRESGQVSRDYEAGRWCGYAVVGGQRSNVDCYTVGEPGVASPD